MKTYYISEKTKYNVNLKFQANRLKSVCFGIHFDVEYDVISTFSPAS